MVKSPLFDFAGETRYYYYCMMLCRRLVSEHTFGPERVVGFGSAFGAESSARSSSMAAWNLLLQRQTTRQKEPDAAAVPPQTRCIINSSCSSRAAAATSLFGLEQARACQVQVFPPLPFSPSRVSCLLSLASGLSVDSLTRLWLPSSIFSCSCSSCPLFLSLVAFPGGGGET